jgi:hypothetical protein
MRIQRPQAVLGGTALVAVIGAGCFAAAAAPAPAPVQLTARGQITNERTLDLGARGPSVGDEEIVVGRLYGAEGTTQTGTFEAVCTTTRTGPNRGECVYTFRLRGRGELTGQGHARIPFTRFRNAVTGGTRTFRAARGEVVGESVSAATLQLTFSLVP